MLNENSFYNNKKNKVYFKNSFFFLKCKKRNNYIYLKILSFFFLPIFFLLYKKKLFIINNIKICLCTLGKEENKYVREFVEYYKNYGIDKIFIYDNNNKNGERFEDVLSDYINNKFVKIINFRGIKTPQLEMLNNCYHKNYNKYDWFIMYDIDEFIFLKDFSNIKYFLIKKKFNECQIIHLNRAFYTDNNQIYYKNISVIKRFPKAVYNVGTVKPIIKGHIYNIKITNQHTATSKYQSCDGFGHKKFKKKDFKYHYIKHYFSKSTEEFIDKINKGTIFKLANNISKLNKILYYFLINKITLEKIKFVENGTGINLSILREKIKKI